jgi:hypothetical protein
VQNDLKRTQSIFDASAFLADTLGRYASIELRYGDPEIEDWPQLQKCIVSVYAAVLQYAFAINSAWNSGPYGILMNKFFIQLAPFIDQTRALCC